MPHVLHGVGTHLPTVVQVSLPSLHAHSWLVVSILQSNSGEPQSELTWQVPDGRTAQQPKAYKLSASAWCSCKDWHKHTGVVCYHARTVHLPGMVPALAPLCPQQKITLSLVFCVNVPPASDTVPFTMLPPATPSNVHRSNGPSNVNGDVVLPANVPDTSQLPVKSAVQTPME